MPWWTKHVLFAGIGSGIAVTVVQLVGVEPNIPQWLSIICYPASIGILIATFTRKL